MFVIVINLLFILCMGVKRKGCRYRWRHKWREDYFLFFDRIALSYRFVCSFILVNPIQSTIEKFRKIVQPSHPSLKAPFLILYTSVSFIAQLPNTSRFPLAPKVYLYRTVISSVSKQCPTKQQQHSLQTKRRKRKSLISMLIK